jgi:glutamate dehydrogenase
MINLFSVHRYVVLCLEKMKLKEDEISKVQTGGPDGDLGSNEILISRDKVFFFIKSSNF